MHELSADTNSAGITSGCSESRLTSCWHFQAGFVTTVTPYKARLLRQILSCTLQPSCEPAPWTQDSIPNAGFTSIWKDEFLFRQPGCCLCSSITTALLPLSACTESHSASSFTAAWSRKADQTTLPLSRATSPTASSPATFQPHSPDHNHRSAPLSWSAKANPNCPGLDTKPMAHSLRTSPDRARMKPLENSSWERTNGISLSLHYTDCVIS